jgi:hypothetical protein
MRVQFALIENGQPVIADTIVLTAQQQEKTYQAKTGDMSRSYVVAYTFGRPASLQIHGPAYKSAFAIGVHESSDWESVGVGTWATLAFKCTPLR